MPNVNCLRSLNICADSFFARLTSRTADSDMLLVFGQVKLITIQSLVANDRLKITPKQIGIIKIDGFVFVFGRKVEWIMSFGRGVIGSVPHVYSRQHCAKFHATI